MANWDLISRDTDSVVVEKVHYLLFYIDFFSLRRKLMIICRRTVWGCPCIWRKHWFKKRLQVTKFTTWFKSVTEFTTEMVTLIFFSGGPILKKRLQVTQFTTWFRTTTRFATEKVTFIFKNFKKSLKNFYNKTKNKYIFGRPYIEKWLQVT